MKELPTIELTFTKWCIRWYAQGTYHPRSNTVISADPYDSLEGEAPYFETVFIDTVDICDEPNVNFYNLLNEEAKGVLIEAANDALCEEV